MNENNPSITIFLNDQIDMNFNIYFNQSYLNFKSQTENFITEETIFC